MKRIYLIITAAAMFFAAEANAQIGIGAGYSMLINSGKSMDEKDFNSLDGFYIEASYGINFLEKKWGDLGIQPGIRFTYGGYEDSEKYLGITAKSSMVETYLDIPILVKYSYDLNNVMLSAFAGPVVSFGLSSVSKLSINNTSSEVHNYKDLPYGKCDVRFNLGLGATFIDKYMLKVGYDFGLLNRYTGDLDNVSLHTGVLYVGLGYNF